MTFILLGTLLGVLAGLLLPFRVPIIFAKYISVAFLAALDSILGGGRAVFERHFHVKVFLSGFLVNTLLAALLTYVGDKLGVDLYLAAVVTFGVRIFQDLTSIRRAIFEKNGETFPQHVHKEFPV